MALRFYKHGQGKLSRGVCALGVGLLGGFGCHRLYYWLGGFKAFREEIGLFEGLLGTDILITPSLLVSIGALLVLTLGIYVLSNHPKVADFLLDTEAEMKKISWPSRNEIIGSSIVVLVVVVLLGLYILLVDAGLTKARDLWSFAVDAVFGK